MLVCISNVLLVDQRKCAFPSATHWEGTLRVLGSVSGFPVQESHGHAGVNPAKGHQMRWYREITAKLFLAVWWTGLQQGLVYRASTRSSGHDYNKMWWAQAGIREIIIRYKEINFPCESDQTLVRSVIARRGCCIFILSNFEDLLSNLLSLV